MARRYNPDTFNTQTGAIVRWVESTRFRRIVRALGPTDGQSVLDVGCGTGILMQQLHAGRLTGADLSEDLLAAARQKFKARPDVEFYCADAEELPFEANTFDGVTCTEMIEHVLHPEKVLDEIYRVAKPGARVVLSFPNEALINAAKRVIHALGITTWVMGTYTMPENNLEEWHLHAIRGREIVAACAGRMILTHQWKVPSVLAPFHTLMAFVVRK